MVVQNTFSGRTGGVFPETDTDLVVYDTFSGRTGVVFPETDAVPQVTDADLVV